MSRRLLNKSDNLSGIMETVQEATQAPPFPTCKLERRPGGKRKPLLPDKFSIPTFPSRTEFDSVRRKISNNLKERAQIMEAQGKLLLGPSLVVLRGRVGG